MSQDKEREIGLNKEDLSLVQEGEDFKDSVIERKNITNQFTLRSVEKHQQMLRKALMEVKATVNVAKAMVRNVEKNHKELLDSLTEEQRHHIWMHKEQSDIVKEGEPKLEDIKEEVARYKEYVDVIYDAFDFKKEEENGEETTNTSGESSKK